MPLKVHPGGITLVGASSGIFLSIFAKYYDYHQFPCRCGTYNKSTHKSCCSRRSKNSNCALAHNHVQKTKCVGWFSLQMAFGDIQHFIKHSADMESYSAKLLSERDSGSSSVSIHLRLEKVYSSLLRYSTVFGTQDRGYFRQIKPTDSNQLIYNLLLFVLQLHGVGECLPFTAAASAKMAAERIVRCGGGYQAGDISLHIASSDSGDLYIHHISGNCLRHK